MRYFLTYVFLGIPTVVSGTVFHENGTDNVAPMESDLDIALVVKAHISQDSQHRAY
jgi:hypothetical protein